jgi:hypothetical protein
MLGALSSLRLKRPTTIRRIAVAMIATTMVMRIGTPVSRSHVPCSRNASMSTI